MPLVPGSRLDSYEIVAPLGAGGMGEVYRARDASETRRGDQGAPRLLVAGPERLRRFELEAQATAALNHPNIVSIFHVGKHDGSSLHRDRVAAGRNSARSPVARSDASARGLRLLAWNCAWIGGRSRRRNCSS